MIQRDFGVKAGPSMDFVPSTEAGLRRDEMQRRIRRLSYVNREQEYDNAEDVVRWILIKSNDAALRIWRPKAYRKVKV